MSRREPPDEPRPTSFGADPAHDLRRGDVPHADTGRIRGLYTTLSPTIAHLDGGYDVLRPETVIRSVGASLRASPAQPGSVSPGSRWSTATADAARVAVADLVGGDGGRVALAATLPDLLRLTAWRLSRNWQLGDEIVVTRLDHDRNVEPWIGAARATGATVRTAEVDVETGELPPWQYDDLLRPHTRLVVLPVANPVTGAVVAIRPIADAAHDVGALVVADATAALPHVPLDLDELGLDGIALGLAGVGGPSLGALAMSGRLWDAVLAGLPGRRFAGSPDLRSARADVGPLPVELLAGVPAIVDHLASLADPDDPDLVTGTRRTRVLTSLLAVAAAERSLDGRLRAALTAMPGVTVVCSSGPRIPVFGLAVEGMTPEQVGEGLLAQGVSVWTGPTGVESLLDALGADEIGGVCVVGVMPYTSAHDVNRLLLAVGQFAAAA